jgi:hypothetical protein
MAAAIGAISSCSSSKSSSTFGEGTGSGLDDGSGDTSTTGCTGFCFSDAPYDRGVGHPALPEASADASLAEASLADANGQ